MRTAVLVADRDAGEREALRRIVADLAHRVAVLEQQAQRPRARLKRGDAALLEKLLPAVVGRLGSEPFCSRDLIEDSALHFVLGNRSVKTIGRLLARSVAAPVGGLVVERDGVELGVTLWRIAGALPSAVSQD